ncbi:MAG TPA: APC family permease [Actinomycetota bacterium]|nr:APC family permease [Actinomycetota bacterium]
MATTTKRGTTQPAGILKRLVVGRALASHKQEHQLLPKALALPVFASDQLSSVAYATEQLMLVLVVAGAAALTWMLPLGICIALLLAVVIASYRQTCRAYPRGGGSYIVSKENLGTVPGLVAAAAIQTSYVLTVSVSVTAGAIAVTSAARSLVPYKVPLALAFVLIITIANLRGVREAGTLFALPTYGFVAMVFVTLAFGFVRCLDECPQADTSDLPLESAAGLSAFLLLRAFSSGATALTGVEAIADGVQAFRRPQAKNAATTLALMGAMSIPMFLGITLLARLLEVRVNEHVAETRSVLSQIGLTVFGRTGPFWILQALTAAILVLAANTAYQDFPRLASILARDRFMPSQFRNRGDRLVFSNGVLSLTVLAGVLVWLFQGELSRLIHLYVVGVFTAITLSQAGMVRKWLREKGQNWRWNLTINGVGVTATGVVLAIVAITQFALGAWIVIASIPVIVGIFLAIRTHYDRVGGILRAKGLTADREAANTFVFLIEDLDTATLDAISYLRALRPEDVRPLYVGSPRRYASVAEGWEACAPRLGRLELLEGGHERLVRALRRYIQGIVRGRGDFVTVVIPEELRGRSLFQFLVNRDPVRLKTALLFEPGVVVTDVPLVPEEMEIAKAHAAHPVEPERNVVLIPMSAVHDATIRAVIYAKSLNPTHMEGMFFVSDPEDVEGVVDEWHQRKVDVPLVLVEAPFRELGEPLLAEVRKYTEDGDTIVTIVLPEFIPRHWWENALHNQTAFYFKRMLLFEPNVVVTDVPFHLRAPEVASVEG